MMRRILIVFIITLLLLSGCDRILKNNNESVPSPSNQLNVATASPVMPTDQSIDNNNSIVGDYLQQTLGYGDLLIQKVSDLNNDSIKELIMVYTKINDGKIKKYISILKANNENYGK